jgi:hypothetical protein
LPLPPQPVLTRWGTWLDAAEYYCETYTVIEEIVNNFDSSEAFSIKIVKELFSISLSGSLAYIKSNYGGIATTISRLEAVGADLHESLELIKGVECETGRAIGKIGDAVVDWFVGLEARQLIRLFAPIYNWGEIYSCDVYIKNNKKLKTKGKAV